MSQVIHQAQTVKKILSDASLSAGERSERALRAFREIDIDQREEASQDQWSADFEQIGAAVAGWRTTLDQSEEMLAQGRLGECKTHLNSLISMDSRMHELLNSAASRLIEAELDRIIAQLDADFRVLPEGAIREAREHRDLIVPRLIQVLQDAIAKARVGDIPKRQGHFFAAFLLTELKAEEAFETMLEAFSLADDLPSKLFGDAIHDIPMRMLALFRGDRPEAIEALIDDRTLNKDIRWQAASSYLYLVREGRIGRDEAVRRLQGCLRRAIDSDDKEVVGPLICELENYAPVEVLSEIREAFDRGLVDGFLVGMSEIERSIAEGSSRLEEEFEMHGPIVMDTLEELRTWAAFQPRRPARPARSARQPLPLSPSLPLEAVLPAPRLEDPEPPPAKPEPIVASGLRVGRNDPCPCGSGKKFKKCCGARV